MQYEQKPLLVKRISARKNRVLLWQVILNQIFSDFLSPQMRNDVER